MSPVTTGLSRTIATRSRPAVQARRGCDPSPRSNSARAVAAGLLDEVLYWQDIEARLKDEDDETLGMRMVMQADVEEPLARVSERSQAMATVLRRALAREADDRHADAGEMALDLRSVQWTLGEEVRLGDWLETWMAESEPSNRLWMLSMMTTAASTMAPMAIAMPPSDMILAFSPWIRMTRNAKIIPTGNEMTITMEDRKWNRKRMHTSTTTRNSWMSFVLSVSTDRSINAERL